METGRFHPVPCFAKLTSRSQCLLPPASLQGSAHPIGSVARRHGSHQLNHPRSTWQVEPSKVTRKRTPKSQKISSQTLSIRAPLTWTADITMTFLMRVLTRPDPKTRNGNPNWIKACCAAAWLILASGTVLQEIPTNCNLSPHHTNRSSKGSTT